MKVLSIPQTRAADQHSITHEPISSINLMERAAQALLLSCRQLLNKEDELLIFCGKGNNGGDGLALARLLFNESFKVKVYYLSEKGSEDFNTNWRRLAEDMPKIEIEANLQLPKGSRNLVIIDALFGSGLNRVLEPPYLNLIKSLNQASALKIAIDMPSGLMGDEIRPYKENQVFKADYSLTFQYPKYAQLHPLSSHYCGQLKVLDIGLDKDFISQSESSHYFHPASDLSSFLKVRKKHSYKGTYGHLWGLCGNANTMGAALISAESALRCGLGLLTMAVPPSAFSAFNARLPEAMLRDREGPLPSDWSAYKALLIGPGLGQEADLLPLIEKVLEETDQPIVLDADALNLLAENQSWYKHLKSRAILSPHPGELKRLLGVTELGSDQLDLVRELAKKEQINILLKGVITVLVVPDGDFHFYDLGCSALAKGGSGDLLAGAIASFLAQGYPVFEAVSLALLVQGSAAKIASDSLGHAHAVLSQDVLKAFGKAFRQMEV